MNAAEFKKRGHEMIDYVADFMDKIRERSCLPSIEPGYLASRVPAQAPEKPESWSAIMKDIEPCIMEGMAHWQHPHFHAYFPAGNSWPSIMGDIFSNGTAISCSSWKSCPAATELEMIVLDWVAKFSGIPDFFYSKFSNPASEGGGVIQGSASECILLPLIAAREKSVKLLRKQYPKKPRAVLLRMLTAYASSQSHSAIEKNAVIANVTLRLVDTDERGRVRGQTLIDVMKKDRDNGFIPFFYSAILGSTSICAFDDLEDLGPICQSRNIWLHVDGAYAGSSFCCPEMRYLMKGLEYAQSFNLNCNKWMLTNFDCSLLWLKKKSDLIDCLSGNDETLRGKDIVDLRHWGIANTRRFRAMKLWLVLKSYGVEGLRNYVRLHTHLAKLFEKYVLRDGRFEVIGETRVGLCCFRLVGPNSATTKLLEMLNFSKKVHMVPANFQGKFTIRFALCAEHTTEKDIEYAWGVISEYATTVINNFAKLSNEDISEIQQLTQAQEKMEKELEARKPEDWEKQIKEEAKKYFAEYEKGLSGDKLPTLVHRGSIVDSFFSERKSLEHSENIRLLSNASKSVAPSRTELGSGGGGGGGGGAGKGPKVAPGPALTMCTIS